MSTASSSRIFLSVVAVLALGFAGASAAPPKPMPDTENGRYALSSTADGVLRLDIHSFPTRCSSRN